jgi:hypothetical protein
MYLFYFYVPESHIELVKHALFAQGLGKLGQYDRCCWQVKGQGEFHPLAGSQPFKGKQNATEQVEEYRVEMLCPPHLAKQAVAALRQTHPYEQPAYGILPLADDTGAL